MREVALTTGCWRQDAREKGKSSGVKLEMLDGSGFRDEVLVGRALSCGNSEEALASRFQD